MAKKREEKLLDNMLLAVARARAEGDGNIGKTEAPTGAVADSAEDNVLTELGIPEDITTPTKRRVRRKAPAKKKVVKPPAVPSSKERDAKSRAETAAAGNTSASTADAGNTPASKAHVGTTSASKAHVEATSALKPQAKGAAKTSEDHSGLSVSAKKPDEAASQRRESTRPKATPPLPAKVVFRKTRRSIPERDLLARNRVIADSANDSRVEAYRQLRSQTLRLLRKHDLKNFAITSAHEGAGKTLTGVNLAISMSMERNQTVLLVDLDLRKPSVHTTLGLETEYGVIDHLRSGVAVKDILVDPGYERLLILPGRAVAGNLSELLTAPEMNSLVREITSRYQDRIVIFDLPPLLRNDDAMSFLPQVDACMFVIEEDVTTTSQMRQSMGLLADTLLLGTVLNKAV